MRLIPTRNNSIEPRGAIGMQTCGIIFWQKVGFLRHCNLNGYNAIISLLKNKYKPTRIDRGNDFSFLVFDNDEEKIVYITLKNERNGKHFFLYGEAHIAYTDAEFHIKVLAMIAFIAHHMGTAFYVNDATNYDKVRIMV